MDRFLVLLRHGIAHPRGTQPEETRSLTDEGHRRMKEIAPALARIFDAEAIYSSPLLRCVETAKWVENAYRGVELKLSDGLRPEASDVDFIAFLAEVPFERVICVGHEPTLSTFMRRLTRIEGDVSLKKGGCYGIRLDEGRLEWMLPPRVLRRA